jgi:hypothetical protein
MIAHHAIDPGVTFRMPKNGLFLRIGTGFVTADFFFVAMMQPFAYD